MAGQIPQIVPDLPAAGFDGQPLTTLYGEPMDVVRFLPLAIRLTAALAEAHQRQLIHQNLQPRAILVDPTSGDVQLIHFAPTAGLACRSCSARRFAREHARISGPRADWPPALARGRA